MVHHGAFAIATMEDVIGAIRAQAPVLDSAHAYAYMLKRMLCSKQGGKGSEKAAFCTATLALA